MGRKTKRPEKSKSPRQKRGSGNRIWKYTWATLGLVLIMGFGLLLTMFYVVRNVSGQDRCTENLKQIYGALELHEIDKGQLPSLAFYPADPAVDDDSMCVVLQKFGLDRDVFICPSSSKRLKETGLTYLWNPNLNGRQLFSNEQPVWMVVEIHVLSDKIGTPHMGHFHILYTDGEIEHTDHIPAGVRSSEHQRSGGSGS
jgi:hypothetical protein